MAHSGDKPPSLSYSRGKGRVLGSPDEYDVFHVAPIQTVLAVLVDPETQRRAGAQVRWGLVPFWAKDAKIAYSLINAKAETVAEKPAFRKAFKARRCTIPADGFYEWKKLDAKTKQPYCIAVRDRAPFGFAGLWERWTDKASGEVVRSCTIIATTPQRGLRAEPRPHAGDPRAQDLRPVAWRGTGRPRAPA